MVVVKVVVVVVVVVEVAILLAVTAVAIALTLFVSMGGTSSSDLRCASVCLSCLAAIINSTLEQTINDMMKSYK